LRYQPQEFTRADILEGGFTRFSTAFGAAAWSAGDPLVARLGKRHRMLPTRGAEFS
jgi:hypothetical protein